MMDAAIIELQGLEAMVEITRRYGLPPGIKPCIAKLLSSWFTVVGTPSSAEACFYVAVELRRLGMKQEAALAALEEWNTANLPPRKPQELKGSVKSAWAKDYNYSCHPNGKGRALAGTAYCIGHDLCPYYRQSGQVSVRDYGGPWLLYAAGWGPYLRASSKEVYIGVQLVEKYRRILPGSPVYVGYRDLADLVGIHRNTVGVALDQLNVEGLILLKKGNPQGRGQEATEITRVVPIPSPSACSLVTIPVHGGDPR